MSTVLLGCLPALVLAASVAVPLSAQTATAARSAAADRCNIGVLAWLLEATSPSAPTDADALVLECKTATDDPAATAGTWGSYALALARARSFGAMHDAITQAADRGDASALILRGLALDYGWGLSRDEDQALAAYLAAATDKDINNVAAVASSWGERLGVTRVDRDAIRLSKAAALRGWPKAQTELGHRYFEGRGVGQDDATAVRWFRAAADQGDAEGELWLGVAVGNGRGTAQNPSEGARLIRLAAEQGHPEAQYRFGGLLLRGEGVAANELDAWNWIRRAAEQEFALAERALGIHFAQREPADDAEAVRWWRRAWQHGDTEATVNLAWMLADGRGTARDEREAVRLFRGSADAGHAGAQLGLGVMYLAGRGVSRSRTEAVRWFTLSADAGNVDAQVELGLNALQARRPDLAAATKWFSAAAEQGSAAARFHLGRIAAGRSDRSGEQEAVRLFREAAAAGDPDAQLELGIRAETGAGVQRDPREAVEWYRKAAAQNVFGAQLRLARATAEGLGTPANDDEAQQWFDRAIASAPAGAVLQEVVREMNRLGAYDALPALSAKANSPDQAPGVRAAAIRALGRLRDPRASAVLTSLVSLEDENLRSAALDAIAREPDVSDPPEVAKFLRDTSALVRAAAMKAVLTLRPGRPDLVRPLLRDSDPDVRAETSRELGRLHDRPSTEDIFRLLDDPEIPVRRAAAEALGDMGDTRAVARLKPLVTHPDADVRVAAIGAIGRLGDPSAADAIVGRLADDDEAVVAEAARVLAGWKDRRAVPVLEKLAEVPDAPDRDLAAAALITFGEKVKVDADLVRGLLHGDLSRLLDDHRQQVVDLLFSWATSVDDESRFEAAEALADAGDPRGPDALIAVLRTRPERMLLLTSRLQELGRVESARNALVSHLRSPDPAIRAEALSALEPVADNRVIPALVSLVNEGDLPRDQVAQILARLGDPRGLDWLEALAASPAAVSRVKAMKALRAISDRATLSLGDMLRGVRPRPADPRVVRLLADRLRDSNPFVRAAAAEGLGWTMAPNLVDLLGTAIQDSHPLVRDRAVRALIGINDKAAHDLSRTYLRNGATQSLAVRILTELSEAGDSEATDRLIGLVDMLDEFSLSPTLLEAWYSREPQRLQARVLDHPSLYSSILSSAKLSVIPAFSLAAKGLSLEARRELVRSAWTAPALAGDSDAYPAPVDSQDADPIFHLAVARKHLRYERFSAAEASARQGLATALPYDIDTRLALQLSMAESQWRRQDLLRSMETVSAVIASLPPRSKFDHGIPLATRAHFVKGAILQETQRYTQALTELETAEKFLAIEFSFALDSGADYERQLIVSRRAAAYKALARDNNQRAAEAVEIGRRLIGDRPAEDPLLRSAEDLTLEKGLEANLELGINGDQTALQLAHQIAEEISLRRQSVPAGLRPADPGRLAAQEQLEALQLRLRELKQGGVRSGPRSAEEASRLSVELSDAQGALRQFVADLKQSYPEVAALLAAKPIELKIVQGLLGPARRLVQYILMDDQGWVFVASAVGVDVIKLAVGQRQLLPLVQEYRRLLDAQAAGSAAGPEEATRLAAAASQLAQYVLQPMAGRLAGVTQLVIIPSGPLHLLPFSALPWDKGFLVESLSISTLSSASMLTAVARPAASGGKALVIGNTRPNDPEWSDLPRAVAEANTVAGLFPGVRPLLGPQGRKGELVGVDRSGYIVHLALHAEAGSSAKTRLVFSDGYITLREVWGLALEGAPLVVLSACETAVGEQLRGDDVMSLSNGFIYAGSRAVVASLWKVSDSSTPDLMRAFYAYRESGTADALARAQRDLIQKGYGPSHWAAFIAQSFEQGR